MTTYRTFKRSCRNWKEFANSSRKLTEERGLTLAEAIRFCDNANKNLTPAQKKRGTMYEFESE